MQLDFGGGAVVGDAAGEGGAARAGPREGVGQVAQVPSDRPPGPAGLGEVHLEVLPAPAQPLRRTDNLHVFCGE